jgi:hypothetical protein
MGNHGTRFLQSAQCNICGPNQVVTNPNAPLNLLGIDSTTCGALFDLGVNGGIPSNTCLFIATVSLRFTYALT